MKIGAHESAAGGVSKAVQRALDDRCECLQIFVKSPNRWQGPEISDKEAKAFKTLAETIGKENIVTHSAYLINLASPKDDARDQSIKAMKDEMQRCDKIGVGYYVLHPGSPLDSGYDAGIRRIVYGIDEIYQDESLDVMLLLEITSGSGRTIGGKLEDIAGIIEKVKKHDKVGLCLDTCHMYSAGYDIADDYERVMDRIITMFGGKLRCIHLNDSKFGLGTHKDRHELIGKGTLGIETFRRFVNDRRLESVLGVLETPVAEGETYASEIKLLKSLRS